MMTLPTVRNGLQLGGGFQRETHVRLRDERTTSRGFTLIELMVVIATLTVLFGFVGTVFHRLFVSEQSGMRAAFSERTVSRLAAKFRDDVHIAGKAVTTDAVDDKPARLVMTLSNEAGSVGEAVADSKGSRMIVYSIKPNEVVRDAILDGAISSREVYRLPDCRISLAEQTTTASAKWVGLNVTRLTTTVSSKSQTERKLRPLHIDAELGRIARLMKPLRSGLARSANEESK